MAESSTALPDLIASGVEMATVWLGHEILAPGAGFAASVIGRYLLGRRDNAQAILRSELERAGATAKDFRNADQFAAGAVRYMRAARDQAADENLRILAQAMIGCARQQELWASEFLRYAEILAPLTRPELTLLGMLMAEHRRYFAEPKPDLSQFALWATFSSTPDVVEQVGWPGAVAAQAQRSGLITLVNDGQDGMSYYMLTDTAIQLRDVVDINAAIRSSEK